jgi:signal transduction histidine kinase
VPGFAYSFKRIKDSVDSSREERERVRQLHYDWSRIMSHEIHTPLSVVYGYIGMIQEKDIPDHLRQEIDGISRGLHRLLNTASLFDAVNQRVTIHPFVLQDAIREALNSDLLWVATRHKPGDVKIVFEDKQKTDIQSDKSKLKTAVAELVRNAIKVSKKGDAVRIIIHDNPDKNYLLISVIDYDGGIPVDQQNRIWEPGVQLYSDMSSRPLEGSGSGLPTVARIADMLGGSAYLEQSGLGMGSVFIIRLPRRVV